MEDLKRIEAIVMEGDDLTEMHHVRLELDDIVHELYIKIDNEYSKHDKIELKAKLTKANSLKEILRDRVRMQATKEAKKNYNFRLAARDMLQKKTYEAILKMARLPRKDVKEAREELRSNKLE